MRMIAPDARHSLVERVVEQAIFASRWFLAPIYIGLAAGLLVLLVKFVQRTTALLTHVLTTDGDNTIAGILALVDLALICSLVVGCHAIALDGKYRSCTTRSAIHSQRLRP